jgi:hypothetical protein
MTERLREAPRLRMQFEDGWELDLRHPLGERAPVRPPAAARCAVRPARPGMWAPRADRVLYRALESGDPAAVDRAGARHPDVGLAATALAGALSLAAGEASQAEQRFEWVISTGRDPGRDPFVRTYAASSLRLSLAPGVTVEVSLSRPAVVLVLAGMRRDAGDLRAAVELVTQLRPTVLTTIALVDLYGELGRRHEILDMTADTANRDDLSALACVLRGVTLRDLGHIEPARRLLGQVMDTETRSPAIRQRAQLELLRCDSH